MDINLNLSLYVIKNGICIANNSWLHINNTNFSNLIKSAISPILTQVMGTDCQLLFGGMDNYDQHDLSYIFYDLMHFGQYIYWYDVYDIIICQTSTTYVQYLRNGVETIIDINAINKHINDFNDVLNFNLTIN